MSKYCDYEKDDFYDCIAKDNELGNILFDSMMRDMPLYKIKKAREDSISKFTYDLKSCLSEGLNQFSIKSYGVPYNEMLNIAKINNLDF